MRGMGVVVVVVILVIVAAPRSYSDKDCPPMFEWVNTTDSAGCCVCDDDTNQYNIVCDQRNQRSFLPQGSCAFYYSDIERVGSSWCPFVLPSDSLEENGLFPLPDNVSELNSVVCGNLSREVTEPLCGRCTNNTGPSIYSIGSRCVPCSYVNIIYYLLLQYLPSTLIFLIVIIFRPNITSAPMICYIIFCNSTVYYMRYSMWLYLQLNGISFAPNLAKFALTLSAMWSFDALLFLSPPLCIYKHMEEIYTPFLQFIATLYPFLLLFLTNLIINLHSKNCAPVTIAWRAFSRVFVQCYRAWDPRSSMIHAFASLFFISYAKIAFIIWKTFECIVIYSNKGEVINTVLYVDPNVVYLSTKHIVLMAFSVTMAVFVFLPPLLILVIYPTSLYRKISHRIQPKWRLRIKTYVETVHSCLKDGTNGTRDYRSLSGLTLLMIIVLPQIIIIVLGESFGPRHSYYSSCSIIAILFSALAILCALLQPYKEHMANSLTVGFLTISSTIFASVTGIYSSENNNLIKLLTVILMLVPHATLWSYVAWRIMKFSRKCFRRSERKRLLDSVTENYEATVLSSSFVESI